MPYFLNNTVEARLSKNSDCSAVDFGGHQQAATSASPMHTALSG